MVKLTLALLNKYRVALYELGGAGLIVGGTAAVGGEGPALIVGGVCLLAKSLEHDLKRSEDRRR